MRSSTNTLYGNALTLAAATMMLTPAADAYSPDTGVPCLPDYRGARSTRSVTIPDGAAEGVTLGPLTLATAGMLTDVAVAVTISHPYAGDVELTLGYDADRDGEPNAIAPLAVYLARPDICIGEEAWSCPVELHGTYAFKDDAWSEAGCDATLDAFEGLPADGDWYLTVIDNDPGDVGTISGWSVYAAAESETFVTTARNDRRGTLHAR